MLFQAGRCLLRGSGLIGFLFFLFRDHLNIVHVMPGTESRFIHLVVAKLVILAPLLVRISCSRRPIHLYHIVQLLTNLQQLHLLALPLRSELPLPPLLAALPSILLLEPNMHLPPVTLSLPQSAHGLSEG